MNVLATIILIVIVLVAFAYFSAKADKKHQEKIDQHYRKLIDDALSKKLEVVYDFINDYYEKLD